MKNLSISSVIEKNKISSNNALVFALDIDIFEQDTGKTTERIRLVNYPKPLTIEGNEYLRFSFNMDFSDESGEIQNLKLTLNDQAGLIMPYLRKYKGGLGSTVLVRLVTITPEDLATSVDFSEVFEVVNSSVSDYVISFDLGAENPLSRICPSRTQMRDRCSFHFKGEECGYEKSMTKDIDLQTCDLSLLGDNGCRKHNNSSRYGGFPAITIINL